MLTGDTRTSLRVKDRSCVRPVGASANDLAAFDEYAFTRRTRQEKEAVFFVHVGFSVWFYGEKPGKNYSLRVLAPSFQTRSPLGVNSEAPWGNRWSLVNEDSSLFDSCTHHVLPLPIPPTYGLIKTNRSKGMSGAKPDAEHSDLTGGKNGGCFGFRIQHIFQSLVRAILPSIGDECPWEWNTRLW